MEKILTPENVQKLALVYCRVSTKGQQEEGTSLETQAEACIKHPEKNKFSRVRPGLDWLDRSKWNFDSQLALR